MQHVLRHRLPREFESCIDGAGAERCGLAEVSILRAQSLITPAVVNQRFARRRRVALDRADKHAMVAGFEARFIAAFEAGAAVFQ